MIKKSLFTTFMLMLAAGIALANPTQSQINAMRPIPGTQMQMVEANGNVYFVSPNGRYVLRGTLHDMWTGGEKVETVKHLEEKANRIDLSQMKLNLDDITDISLGKGDKEVALFVSPGCPHCEHAMEQITEEMKKNYTFKIVPLPILGKTSQIRTKQLACVARKNPAKAVEMLMTKQYPEVTGDEECPLDKVARATLTSNLLDITGVPFLIAPDGRVSRGAPKNLAQFLSQGDK